MSPARFLELYFASGGDCYRRADGKVVFTAPKLLLDAVIPQIKALGREAILDELARQDRESKDRLSRMLKRDLPAGNPGDFAPLDSNPAGGAGETSQRRVTDGSEHGTTEAD